MSILDKIKSANLSTPKEMVKKGFDSVKTILILTAILGAFVGGYVIGTRAFETGNLGSLKNANITISGVCTFASTGEERYPALLDDEVKVNAVDTEKNTLLVVVRKTREDLLCDLNKVSYTALPLLSKWGNTPVAVPELTTAVPVKRNDPYWKMFEKKTMVVSGTCNNTKGETLPNLIDEKVEVVSTTGVQEEGQFVLTGLKRSDRLSIVCSSKLITYRIFDPATEPKESVKVEAPLDFTGQIVMIDSKCIPDPKYLKERKIDPKTKKPIGKVPKFYNLLNTPVQVLSYKTNESNKITYLEGKIVDQSSLDSYGKKIICDSNIEALVVKYDVEKTDSLINQKGDEINTKKPISNLEVVTDGEDALVEKQKVQSETIEPKEKPVIDENQRLQDVLKELEK